MSENSPLIVVPAQPGFDLVEPCRNAQGVVDELVLIPIVAWAIEVIWRRSNGHGDCYEGSVAYAVTIESPNNPLRQVIRTPTGKFHFCEDRIVDDEAAAIAEFNRDLAKTREAPGKAGVQLLSPHCAARAYGLPRAPATRPG